MARLGSVRIGLRPATSGYGQSGRNMLTASSSLRGPGAYTTQTRSRHFCPQTLQLLALNWQACEWFAKQDLLRSPLRQHVQPDGAEGGFRRHERALLKQVMVA